MDYCDFVTVSWTPGPLPEESDFLFAGEWVDMPLVLTKAGRPRAAGRVVKWERAVGVGEGKEVVK